MSSVKGQKSGKKGEYHRHWYILCKPGDCSIRVLISAFSLGHIKRKLVLEDEDVIIHKAKRWHIARVFSGSAVFYDYLSKYKGVNEDVNALVPNEFHMVTDGEKTLVRILS